MVMSRWDPFGEALSLRDAMNRLLEQAVLQPAGDNAARGSAAISPAMDVRETQDAYTVRASLPGLKPEDLNVQIQQGVLTLSGEIREEEENEQGSYHVRERRFGLFARSISFPSNVDADKVEAKYENGVLELRIPKAEESKPRRIEVRSGGAQQIPTGKGK
jgi:HSP20 family protein